MNSLHITPSMRYTHTTGPPRKTAEDNNPWQYPDDTQYSIPLSLAPRALFALDLTHHRMHDEEDVPMTPSCCTRVGRC
jgi:hypothetical protein